MLSPTKKILKKARESGFAVGAFNTSNIEVMEAILKTAEKLKASVIVETSEGEASFAGAEVLVAAFKSIANRLSIPAVLHLDHGKSLETIERVLRAGYTSVHIDGSTLPYEENLKLTKDAVRLARKRNAFVEGELGCIPGVSVVHKEKIPTLRETEMTNPLKAREFVQKTGIDCLAVSIGNIHGVYKNPPRLDFGRLRQISENVSCFLSLHGGSGIRSKDLKKAISLGITKINVNTELRQAYLNELREALQKHPEELRPYKILPSALEAVGRVVEEKIRVFGSTDQV